MTAIRVYDSMSREERDLDTVEPGVVRLYVCGMTPQDKPHIGHFLPFLTADIVRRYLEYRGYRVLHVQNFTDVDDKIIARAQQEGLAPELIAARNIQKCFDSLRAMNLLPATHYPRVTEHIPEIVAMTQTLIDRGYAYAVDGDVYFRVRKFPTYGALSGRDPDDMRSGARIEIGEHKEDPLDFALWKGAKPGEPQWASPWGPGRPGWHIECSAMATKYLGDTLDMHGGGRDLIFPHHENERAQSEAATGKPFVRNWIHNGLLYTDGQKMSKSLGNFFLIDDILEKFSADEVRFYLISTHFRSQAEFSQLRLEESRAAFERLRECIQRLREACESAGEPTPLVSAPAVALRDAAGKVRAEYFECMDHDFNSAGALGRVFELVRESNRFLDEHQDGQDRAALDTVLETFRELLQLLGFFPAGLGLAGGPPAPDAVRHLAEERLRARQSRDWARADELRRAIDAQGWIVDDRPDSYRLKPRP